jgi:hypothetical protein
VYVVELFSPPLTGIPPNVAVDASNVIKLPTVNSVPSLTVIVLGLVVLTADTTI